MSICCESPTELAEYAAAERASRIYKLIFCNLINFELIGMINIYIYMYVYSARERYAYAYLIASKRFPWPFCEDSWFGSHNR